MMMMTAARCRCFSNLSLTVLLQLLFISAAFLQPRRWTALGRANGSESSPQQRARGAPLTWWKQQQQQWRCPSNNKHILVSSMADDSSSSSSSQQATSHASTGDEQPDQTKDMDKNTRYIEGLLRNLTDALDKWILSGSPTAKKRVYNLLEQIETQARDSDLVARATRLIKRAGLPVAKENKKDRKELGRTDDKKRREEAEQRKHWEAARTPEAGEIVSKNVAGARSALGRRQADKKPDLFLGQVDSRLDPQSFASDKEQLQQALGGSDNEIHQNIMAVDHTASAKVSELVAKAGAGKAFDGETLGIGGLDDVLAQVKRRVWTPLAAPPELLNELGIHPVRGLLLYGKPGCGKTLLARRLGHMLSPLRPITVVSGPEILDKFVGSSEKNLREIFDNPPDIYDTYRLGQANGGDAIASAALHVVIMDEFDAIARTRGGRDGKGDQGDAGVARDSVVNQLLAKMDGVDPLVVPTLVIGLTNKRSLIEPALLRPGRFEVQIEVPPPRTIEQRISILKVHTKDMHQAGRLLVRDAPKGTAAALRASEGLPSYMELLERLARECEGFSGASIAGVCRAAASHALERAVEEFTQHANTNSSNLLRDCIVTEEDIEGALKDVIESSGDHDWAEEEDESSDNDSAEMENEESESLV